ncbi:MAG: glycosyltransferase [Panacagrimonas sp.]
MTHFPPAKMPLTPPPVWTLSVVSHGHIAAIKNLLSDCHRFLDQARHEIIVTLNQPESVAGLDRDWKGPLRIIRNARAHGFGANHNAAFSYAQGRYLAVLDPDLKLHGDPFPELAAALDKSGVGIVATRVLDERGETADHARRAPTFSRLVRRKGIGEPRSYGASLDRALDVDWIAGLFMAMRRETHRRLSGFDERFFMYCEDVDLCLRAWNESLAVQVVPAAYVTHPARRQTLRRPRHFFWHCASLARLWSGKTFHRFMQSSRARF